MGASPYKLATLERSDSFPGAIILFKPGKVSGPTVGSVINHIGVTVQSLQIYSGKAHRSRFCRRTPGQSEADHGEQGPDGVRVEMTEDDAATMPLFEPSTIHWNRAGGERSRLGTRPTSAPFPGCAASLSRPIFPA